MKKITRKRRHEAMLEQGMHSGNTDAKFDPPPDPAQTPFTKQFKKDCEALHKRVSAKRETNSLARSPVE